MHNVLPLKDLSVSLHTEQEPILKVVKNNIKYRKQIEVAYSKMKTIKIQGLLCVIKKLHVVFIETLMTRKRSVEDE